MSQQEAVADRILEAVRRTPGCHIDDLEQSLPDLSLIQIFVEVDRLSWTGQLQVTCKGAGSYTLTLPQVDLR
ncbi:MAG: hypothetical protein C4293_17810 [Nitrospiraceae bacterium]